MRFGLNLGNGGPSADPRTMADLAELAEQSGWDGVFLEDYIVYQNKTVSLQWRCVHSAFGWGPT
jgi:alkanesulfonate monooxygenase SsuD/methylene tetrahydromethanopterin reductase-like flavin-dependent oxidoreductase (luciferase family)